MPAIQIMNNSKPHFTKIAWNIMQQNSGIAEILIYDIIAEKQSYNWWTDEKGSEVTPLSFRNDLNNVTTEKICIRINSSGGDVFAAEAIRTAIMDSRQAGKIIKCKVDGLCASAAVGIAAACETISISASSYFMIHDPMAFVSGYCNITDFEKGIEMLKKIKQGIINAYTKKTGKDKEKISGLMTKETWYTGDEAVEAGFCDELMFEDSAADNSVDNVENVAALGIQMFRNLPVSLLNRCATHAPGGFSNITPQNITEKEKKGMPENKEIKTIDDLKANYPALVAAIAQEATAAERKRIQEIENVSLAGFESIVNDAKFANPVAAGDVAKAIVAEQKKQGANYLISREEDVQNSNAGKEGAGEQHEGADGKDGRNEISTAIDKLFPAVK